MNLTEPTHIRPDLLQVCRELDLVGYLAHERTQTSDELLNEADLVIFMDRDVYRDAAAKYHFNHDKSTVWHIADILETAEHMHVNPRSHANQQHIFRQTAHKVQRLCEPLVHDVNRVSWTDVVDENNQPKGYSLPLSWVCSKNLWWRGCHAVLTLPNGDYLVEKRSKTIIFSPSLLDITLGGAIDAGEEPEHSTVRETHEELGVDISRKDLRLIDMRKWSAYHPRYKTHTRVFLYTYHAVLGTNKPVIVPQRSEVAQVDTLTYRQIRWLVRYHRLRHIGRLKTSYRYFDDIIAAVHNQQLKRRC